jgi:hypothetical protein
MKAAKGSRQNNAASLRKSMALKVVFFLRAAFESGFVITKMETGSKPVEPRPLCPQHPAFGLDG